MTARLTEIWRHPIKSCGRESVARTNVIPGQTLPFDRRWAIAHEAAKLDPNAPEWVSCNNFARAAKAPQMQAITAHSDIARGEITLSHPKLRDLTLDPDDPDQALGLIQWLMPLSPADRALPAHVVRADRGMTDTDFPSISLINLASHDEVAARIGRPISPLRWRGNLLIEGLDPWVERDWIGKRLRIGSAEFEVREQITRCLATAASPRTGERDADTLGALQSGWGHKQFGVYAVVTARGEIAQGDSVEVIA